MKKNTIVDGFILVSCVLISGIATYFLAGAQFTLWSALSVLHAYKLFNGPKNYKNYFYVFLWSMTILLGIYIGSILKLSWIFYCYLVVLSFVYYHLYGDDPIIDLSMKYILIFSTVGTSLPDSDLKGLSTGLIVGTLLTLSACFLFSRETQINLSLANPLKEHLFKIKRGIVLRSLVYSGGLILCLFITETLHLGFFYWTLLTFVFVLHPKSVKIIDLTVRRVIGILIAALCLYFIFNTPFMPYIGLFTVLLLTFFLPFSETQDYIFTSACITGFVLAVIELSQSWGTSDNSILFDRVIETIIGGFIAIICSFILKQIREEK